VREARHIGVLDVVKSQNLTQEEGPLALQLSSLDGGFSVTLGLKRNGQSYISIVTISNAGSALLVLDLHSS
jgi:methionine salvage enolase-phosphatase E1